MIIHIVSIIALSFCLEVGCLVPPAQERYLQANTLYQQGDFAKAYDMYRGIQYKSPELLINMGNAAFEQRRFPEAIVCWRQAQQSVKYADYIMLEERIRDVHALDGTAFHSSKIQQVTTRIELMMRVLPQKIWQLIFLLILLVGLFILSWYKAGYWLRITVWFLSIVLITLCLITRYNVQNRSMAVVLRSTPAYVTKDSQARIKASLKSSQEVAVRAIHDTWYLITDGVVTGWVMQNDIQLV